MSNVEKSIHRKWAEFRFSVIGHLLSCPPPRGELNSKIKELAQSSWKHPITQEPTHFSFSTIERWYYQALRNDKSPIRALLKRPRSDLGHNRALSKDVKELLEEQYKQHKSWSVQLHKDNLVHLLNKLGFSHCPSYSTITRYLKSKGLTKRKRRNRFNTNGARKADYYYDNYEIRSYENPYVNGLWHLDFHFCSREIITEKGEIVYPALLAVMDDHSRLVCHAQWYLAENAEYLVHGFCQALAKRGIPRALLTDNGKAMLSTEFTEGLKRLSIEHDTTLPYSPYQNGKSERFWGQLEGRLMAMIDNVDNVTLKMLNDLTLIWCEHEYNKEVHKEIEEKPLDRFLKNKNVGRDLAERSFFHYFRREDKRTIRRTDGSILLNGKRFEIPIQYVHWGDVVVRYAVWDLSYVHIVDKIKGNDICQIYPLNKHRNAETGRRKKVEEITPVVKNTDLPPLLKHLISLQHDTGLPPAYIHKED